MKQSGRFIALGLIGLGFMAEAAPAFSMPVAPVPLAAPAAGITPVQWGWGPPPPGWGPSPDYDRPRPRPPGWGYRPPPPPYYRPPPPPPGWGYRPPPRRPVYRQRPAMSAHVQWCLNRYRSYNPSTNRFLSSSGYYRVCVSPYSY